MALYILPPIFAAFLWWFSTGAVLLLVGLPKRFVVAKIIAAAGLLIVSLYGLAISSNENGSGSAFIAFTSAVLLWGSQEIAFLAGWITGPRAATCPPSARGAARLGYALQAIIYHELSLLACAAAVAVLGWNGVNQTGLWTFATLWVLRQSSKINLFLGVPVTNDELMPSDVQFLKSYFLRKPVSAFFPLSVTAATATLVVLGQRLVEVVATSFEIASLALVSTLFALGVLEHWFMLLPRPAMKLWGWGVKAMQTYDGDHETASVLASATDVVPASGALATPSGGRAFGTPVVALATINGERAMQATQSQCVRQRLEDEFRRSFLQQQARELSAARLKTEVEPAATINGRTS